MIRPSFTTAAPKPQEQRLQITSKNISLEVTAQILLLSLFFAPLALAPSARQISLASQETYIPLQITSQLADTPVLPAPSIFGWTGSDPAALDSSLWLSGEASLASSVWGTGE